jgi:arginine decarboxylase-like protein
MQLPEKYNFSLYPWKFCQIRKAILKLFVTNSDPPDTLVKDVDQLKELLETLSIGLNLRTIISCNGQEQNLYCQECLMAQLLGVNYKMINSKVYISRKSILL